MKYATPEGTLKFSQRFIEKGNKEANYRLLGKTGLTTSALGFGCYRIDDINPVFRQSLELAVLSGVNLIDTSTNYADGGSERCVGRSLSLLFDSGKVKREEIIVVSKIGYVQGENLKIAIAKEREGNAYPDMVRYADGCWHCIHPGFINEQLTRSLSRTKLECVDALLLHNPEYYFSDALHRNAQASVSDLRAVFYERIKRAFKQLEDEVEDGRIRFYGVSSNTFGKDSENGEMTSLAEMVRIAEEVAEKKYGSRDAHHFAIAQLPMNLYESGPFLEFNNEEEKKTTLQVALENQIGVLVNRPLNAFVSNHLVRLADFDTAESKMDRKDLLEELCLYEDEYAKLIAPLIPTEEGSTSAYDFFKWGPELTHFDSGMVGVEQWAQVEDSMILPQVEHVVTTLDGYFETRDNVLWDNWRNKYMTCLSKVLRMLRAECSKRSQIMSDKTSKKLNPHLPKELKNETLSRKVLASLANTAGVSCVLNGMRKPVYVEDSLGAMKMPKFEVTEKLYSSFRMEN